ncbi:MAG: hypothetical protein QM820_05105 [Minicystis sp.]
MRPGAETNTPQRQEPVLLLCETRNLLLITTTPFTSTGTFGPMVPLVMSSMVTVGAEPPVPPELLVVPLLEVLVLVDVDVLDVVVLEPVVTFPPSPPLPPRPPVPPVPPL